MARRGVPRGEWPKKANPDTPSDSWGPELKRLPTTRVIAHVAPTLAHVRRTAKGWPGWPIAPRNATRRNVRDDVAKRAILGPLSGFVTRQGTPRGHSGVACCRDGPPDQPCVGQTIETWEVTVHTPALDHRASRPSPHGDVLALGRRPPAGELRSRATFPAGRLLLYSDNRHAYRQRRGVAAVRQADE